MIVNQFDTDQDRKILMHLWTVILIIWTITIAGFNNEYMSVMNSSQSNCFIKSNKTRHRSDTNTLKCMAL